MQVLVLIAALGILAVIVATIVVKKDSLPAIALGMDRTSGDVMNDKPRDPNESIFARGGMALIIVRGAILTVSVLLSYFSAGWLNGAYTLSEIKNLFASNSEILHQAQTMAFTTLAFGELLHMLGMRDENKSFVTVFKSKNVMMAIAFFVGIALQFAVIEIPAIRTVFSTANLEPME